jgi:choline dehydrogenase-like flavoprotein
MIKAAKGKTMEVMHAAGAEEVVQHARYAHLVGAARVGADPATFGGRQIRPHPRHYIANLFVCDGSIFPTQDPPIRDLPSRRSRPALPTIGSRRARRSF